MKKIFTPNDNISWLDSLLFISLSMQRNIWDGWTIKSIGQWPYITIYYKYIIDIIFIYFVHILKKTHATKGLGWWDPLTLGWLDRFVQPRSMKLATAASNRWDNLFKSQIYVFFTTLNYNDYKQTKKYFCFQLSLWMLSCFVISNVLNVFSLLGRPLFFKRLQTTMNHLLFPQETPMEVGLISYHVCGVNGICLNVYFQVPIWNFTTREECMEMMMRSQ